LLIGLMHTRQTLFKHQMVYYLMAIITQAIRDLEIMNK
jgi:hypothetical protein